METHFKEWNCFLNLILNPACIYVVVSELFDMLMTTEELSRIFLPYSCKEIENTYTTVVMTVHGPDYTGVFRMIFFTFCALDFMKLQRSTEFLHNSVMPLTKKRENTKIQIVNGDFSHLSN